MTSHHSKRVSPMSESGDSTGDEVDLQLLSETIRVEQGRLLYRLAHDSSLEPSETYEIRGQFRAYHHVLHALDHQSELGHPSEHSDEYEALAEADRLVLQGIVADSKDDEQPVDFENGVY